MTHARFTDERTIEMIAQDGEKWTWTTYFPIPEQNRQHFAERLSYYFQKYFEDNIEMNMVYWIWLRMNYDERLGLASGIGDRDGEKIFLYEERVRIGKRIRELRKERNIEAKMLARAVNIDAANLSRIEQGRYSVGVDILSKIAVALGAKIELVDFVDRNEV